MCITSFTTAFLFSKESIQVTQPGQVDVITEMCKAAKQGLAGEAEAQMVASFWISLPAVFCQNQKDDTPGIARHLPIKNYVALNAHDNSSGVKQYYIEMGLNDLCTTSIRDCQNMPRPRVWHTTCWGRPTHSCQRFQAGLIHFIKNYPRCQSRTPKMHGISRRIV